VRSYRRSEGRNCRITASRARSSDIGSERENSRIGTRHPGAFAVADPSADFFRVMRSFTYPGSCMANKNQEFDPEHLTC
jgi:hypothetical protein